MASRRSETWSGLRSDNKECTCTFVCGMVLDLFDRALPNLGRVIWMFCDSRTRQLTGDIKYVGNVGGGGVKSCSNLPMNSSKKVPTWGR